MNVSALLAAPHLTILTRRADRELARIQDLIEHKILVDGRADLEESFGMLLAGASKQPTACVPKTLDLVGHATPGKSLLQLGDWVIDARNATVTAFFRGLAELDVLPRLGVQAVRLLGCETADTGHARSTITTLAEILGIEVYGTRTLIFSAHYNARGFSDDAEHVLVGSTRLLNERLDAIAAPAGERTTRVLDIDALPVAALGREPWPCRIATPEVAHHILRLVRRKEGAYMPGLLATPICELALPSAKPSLYHRAQVLLDGELLRVYPDGSDAPGVVYLVDDPHALRRLVDSLPSS